MSEDRPAFQYEPMIPVDFKQAFDYEVQNVMGGVQTIVRTLEEQSTECRQQQPAIFQMHTSWWTHPSVLQAIQNADSKQAALQSMSSEDFLPDAICASMLLNAKPSDCVEDEDELCASLAEQFANPSKFGAMNSTSLGNLRCFYNCVPSSKIKQVCLDGMARLMDYAREQKAQSSAVTQ